MAACCMDFLLPQFPAEPAVGCSAFFRLRTPSIRRAGASGAQRDVWLGLVCPDDVGLASWEFRSGHWCLDDRLGNGLMAPS